MNEQAKITVQRGYSEDGGFHYAVLQSNEITENERFQLERELTDAGSIRYLTGYSILSERAQKMLGDEFTVADVRAYCVETRRLIDEREARRAAGLVKCACGHIVPKAQVMSTSRGSSCAECYDRMSD